MLQGRSSYRPCLLEEQIRWKMLCAYLLLHPTFQQHRHAGLDREGDLTATDHQVLLQGLPKGRLLHPGLWGGATRERSTSSFPRPPMTHSFSPYPDSAWSTKETEGPDEHPLLWLSKKWKGMEKTEPGTTGVNVTATLHIPNSSPLKGGGMSSALGY